MAPHTLQPWAHSSYATPSSAAPVPAYPEQEEAQYGEEPQDYDPRDQREHARAGPTDVKLPWFLPFFDPGQTLHENAEMRAAYRRMLADPNVKAALFGKIMAVAGYELKIVPADRKSERDGKLADLVRWNLTEAVRGGLPGLVWSIFSGGLVDGYSVCEKVWGQSKRGKFRGAYHLRALKPKDVDHDLILVTDEFRNVSSVRGMRYNPGIEFPPSAFVIYRNLPMYDVPTGMSDLRAVYSRWWLLDTALKIRAVGIDKRALPVIMGHYKFAQDRPALEQALAKVKSQNWLALPESTRVEALSLAGAGDAVLAACVRDLAEDIFLGIAGATLQARQGDVNNARGSSAEHRNTADLFIRALAQAFECILNDCETGLIPEICDLNVEGEVEDYPRGVLQAQDDKDLESRSKLYQTFWEMGMTFSRQAINDEMGFEPPDPNDAEDVLGSKADQEAQVAASTIMAPQGPGAEGAMDRVLTDDVQTGAQQQQQQAGVTGALPGAAVPSEQPAPQMPAQMAEDEETPTPDQSQPDKQPNEPRQASGAAGRTYEDVRNSLTSHDFDQMRPLLHELWPEYTKRDIPDTKNDYAYGIWRMAHKADELHRLPLQDLSWRHMITIRDAMRRGEEVPAEVLGGYDPASIQRMLSNQHLGIADLERFRTEFMRGAVPPEEMAEDETPLNVKPQATSQTPIAQPALPNPDEPMPQPAVEPETPAPERPAQHKPAYSMPAKYAMRTPGANPLADPKTVAWAASPPTRADYDREVEEIIRDKTERNREAAYDEMLHHGELPDVGEDDYEGLEQLSDLVDERASEWARSDLSDSDYDEFVFAHLPTFYLDKDRDFAALHAELKADPTDPEAQTAMNDWLEEHGLDRFKFYFDDDEDHPRARPFSEEEGESSPHHAAAHRILSGTPPPSPDVLARAQQMLAHVRKYDEGEPERAVQPQAPRSAFDLPIERAKPGEAWNPPPANAPRPPAPAAPPPLAATDPPLAATDVRQEEARPPEAAPTTLFGRIKERLFGASPVKDANAEQRQGDNLLADTGPKLSGESLHSLSEDDLAQSRFVHPLHESGTRNTGRIGRVITPHGAAFYKGHNYPERAEGEVRASSLLRLTGAAAPAARTASVPGAPGAAGVMQELLEAQSVGEAIGVGKVSIGENHGRWRHLQATLAPGETTRAILGSFLLGISDRHLDNYLVQGDRLVGIDLEENLFNNMAPLDPRHVYENRLVRMEGEHLPREQFKAAMDAHVFDPAAIGQVLRAARQARRQVGEGTSEAQGIALHAESLLRLLEGGDYTAGALVRIMGQLAKEEEEAARGRQP